ncbi:MAG TPA: Na+/H+ antiporter NhaA [Bacteroidia bacterium]|nr:Na+/H+ antiporter NhaA [Bacteroidia bacterium]
MIQKLYINSIQKFIRVESLSGLLLFAATIIAILWANSPWAESYKAILNFKIGFGSEEGNLIKPLILWINDGLMAIFFFLIGLEIKRELRVGELNSLQKASFPLVAAMAGMIFPALIYFALNSNGETVNGWAIPMATDIAFSLAILKLLGNRAPLSLKIFLTAFAIVDDLGAVIIIAIFYSGGIQTTMLISALLIIAFMALLSKYNLFSKYILLFGGFIVWVLFLKSGIHPTIAGVLLALTVPMSQKIDVQSFSQELDNLVSRLKQSENRRDQLLSSEQIEELDHIHDWMNKVQSPLQNLEHRLHNYVAYFIIPLFAFANAGIEFNVVEQMNLNLVFSIALALVLGKSVGIMLLCTLALKLKITQMPLGINRQQLLGASLLAGVGFTMSIFIANLAFAHQIDLLNSAKAGIILGSIIAGIAGYLVLKRNTKVEFSSLQNT